MNEDALLADLEAGPSRHEATRCLTCLVLKGPTPKVAAKIEDDVIRSPAWTDRETVELLVAHELADEGDVTVASIRGHRQSGHRVDGG